MMEWLSATMFGTLMALNLFELGMIIEHRAKLSNGLQHEVKELKEEIKNDGNK